jgi:futalosine hydrolase
LEASAITLIPNPCAEKEESALFPQLCGMTITIVAATELEIAPAASQIPEMALGARGLDIRFLYTGVGILESTYVLAKRFSIEKPDLAIQAGIAGSFLPAYPPGTVLAVSAEVVGDIGVDEEDGFKNIFDMGFADPQALPYKSGMLENPHHEILARTALRTVRGLTVNEISTDPVKMLRMMEKYHPVVESMEGAPFHYVCLDLSIPFVQIRSVSNFTGERDTSKWDFRGSIEKLNDALIRLIHTFANTP